MRLGTVAMSCTVALLAACTKADDAPAADTTMTSVGPAAPATPITLADLAGTWNVVATPEGGADTAPTLYTMVATADTAGWTFTFANRPGVAIPLHGVVVDGDSLVTEAGPFESSRRAGIATTTRSVLRMQGGRLIGSTLARYAMPDEDQTLVLRTVATRAQ